MPSDQGRDVEGHLRDGAERGVHQRTHRKVTLSRDAAHKDMNTSAEGAVLQQTDQWRPCLSGISVAKQVWAWLVLEWETNWEH